MPRKTAHGSDTSKPPTGYVASRDYEYTEDEKGLAPIVSYSECLDDLFINLDQFGYQFLSSPQGAYCGFDLYAKSQPDIQGLNVPQDFFYYRKVDNKELVHTTVMQHLRVYCEYRRESDGKTAAEVWKQIYLCFADRPRDNQSPVAKIAASRMDTARLTTVTGKKGCHKFVPPLSWFPSHIQDYDPTELLTLLPPAEKRQFCLLLGRAVAGADNTKLAEGIIQHTSRGYSLMIGTEGGLGKSRLMRYIQECVEILGYNVSYLNPNFGKFGWGDIALADFALMDDLNDELQKELMHSAVIKSIVSNGIIKVEEKGQPAYDIRSTATIFACSNTINYTHYFGLDAGSLSRVNQLYTYMQHELDELYNTDARTPAYWQKVAKAKRVNINLLTARLLRHCLDVFLEATGHSIDENGLLVKDIELDTLEVLIKANREDFRIDISLTHAEELPKAVATLTAWVLAHEDEPTQLRLLKRLNRIDFSPELLSILLELWAYQSEPFPQPVEVLNLVHLSTDVRRYLKPKLNAFRNMSHEKTLDRAFVSITEELKAVKGFGYPAKSTHYQQLWVQYRKQIVKTMLGLNDLPLTGIEDTVKRLKQHIEMT